MGQVEQNRSILYTNLYVYFVVRVNDFRCHAVLLLLCFPNE